MSYIHGISSLCFIAFVTFLHRNAFVKPISDSKLIRTAWAVPINEAAAG